jgi:hypothetical protein
MAYMRGDYYVWNSSSGDEDWLHIWSANGYDGWDQSGWACDEEGNRDAGRENASGVSLPLRVMDDFVMMRLAQLIYEGQVEEAIERALPNARGSGNIGGRLLDKNTNVERLKVALRQIKMEGPDQL